MDTSKGHIICMYINIGNVNKILKNVKAMFKNFYLFRYIVLYLSTKKLEIGIFCAIYCDQDGLTLS